LLCLSVQISYAQSITAIKKRADAAFDQKDFESAKVDYRQLLAQNQKNIELNYKYATCIYYTEDIKNARKYYDLILAKKDAEFPLETYFYSGKIYQHQYYFETAIQQFNLLIEKDPKLSLSLNVQSEIAACQSAMAGMKDMRTLQVIKKSQPFGEAFYDHYTFLDDSYSFYKASEVFPKENAKRKYEPIYAFKRGMKFRVFASYGPESTNLDVYIQRKNEENEWGKPLKIQGPVNSLLDESYPFFDAENGYLYFSSKGHQSMGGFDLFRAVYSLETNISSDIENLHFPFSSPNDDYFYIPDLSNGNANFASNRNGKLSAVQTYLVNAAEIPKELYFFTGVLSDKIDQSNSTVKLELIVAETNERFGPFISQADGSYLVGVPGPGTYLMEINVTGSNQLFKEELILPFVEEDMELQQELIYSMVDSKEQIQVVNRIKSKQVESMQMLSQKMNLAANLDVNLASFNRKVELSPQQKMQMEWGVEAKDTASLILVLSDSLLAAEVNLENQVRLTNYLVDQLKEKQESLQQQMEAFDLRIVKGSKTLDPQMNEKWLQESKQLEQQLDSELKDVQFLQDWLTANQQRGIPNIEVLKSLEEINKQIALLQYQQNSEAIMDLLSDKKELIKGQLSVAGEDLAAVIRTYSQEQERSQKEERAQFQVQQENQIQLEKQIGELRTQASTTKGKERIALDAQIQEKEQLNSKLKNELNNWSEQLDAQAKSSNLSYVQRESDVEKILLSSEKMPMPTANISFYLAKEKENQSAFVQQRLEQQQQMTIQEEKAKKWTSIDPMYATDIAQINASNEDPFKRVELLKQRESTHVNQLKAVVSTMSEVDQEWLQEQIQLAENRIKTQEEEIQNHTLSNSTLATNQDMSTETAQRTTETVQPTTNNDQPATETAQPTSDNGQPTTETAQTTSDNGQPATEIAQPTSDNGQPTTKTTQRTTENGQRTTDNGQPTSDNGQRTSETTQPTSETTQPTSETTQPTSETTQPTTENGQRKSDNGQPTTKTTQRTTENGQPTTDNGQPTSDNGQPTTETAQPTTENSQPTTETAQRTTENGQPTTENGQPTTETAQRTTENGQPTTDNGQPTTETTQRTTENGQSTTETAQPTSETTQPTTENGQPTTETVQPTTDNGQRTTETAQPPTENGQRISDNGQRSSDNDQVTSFPETIKVEQVKETRRMASIEDAIRQIDLVDSQSLSSKEKAVLKAELEATLVLEKRRAAVEESLELLAKSYPSVLALKQSYEQGQIAINSLNIQALEQVLQSEKNPEKLKVLKAQLESFKSNQTVEVEQSATTLKNLESLLPISSETPTNLTELQAQPSYVIYANKRLEYQQNLISLDSLGKAKIQMEDSMRILLTQEDEISIREIEQLAKRHAEITLDTDKRTRIIQEKQGSLMEFNEQATFEWMMQNGIQASSMISGSDVSSSTSVVPSVPFAMKTVTTMNQVFPSHPINVPLPEGLIFRVQVGAFRKPVPNQLFREFGPVSGEMLTNGLTCYLAGYFNGSQDALEARTMIRGLGYADAFIVAYCDGKRMTFNQGKAMEANGLCRKQSKEELQLALNQLLQQNKQEVQAPVTTVVVDPNSTEANQDLYFTVQVAVYNKPLINPTIKGVNELLVTKTEKGQFRYSSGEFTSFAEARDRKNQVVAKGIPDAYVVAYYRGKRISIGEANKLLAAGIVPKKRGQVLPSTEENLSQVAQTIEIPVLMPLVKKDSVVQYELKVTDENYLAQLAKLNRVGTFTYQADKNRIISEKYLLDNISVNQQLYLSDMKRMRDNKSKIPTQEFVVNPSCSECYDWLLRQSISYDARKEKDIWIFRFYPENKEQEELILQASEQFKWTLKE
jgi:ACT domain-containing protein